MWSLSATSVSLVVAITAQRLHSKVREFGSGKNFDFGTDGMDMGRSQTGQTGTLSAECSRIRFSTALTPRRRSVGFGGGANRQRYRKDDMGMPVYSEVYTALRSKQ